MTNCCNETSTFTTMRGITLVLQTPSIILAR